MTRELHVVADAEALYRGAAEQFVQRAQAAVRSTGRFTVALSGGATPRGMYRLLAEDPELSRQVPWNSVHFFWGDERHVPPEHPDSNFRVFNESLLSKVPLPHGNVWRIPAEGPDAAAAAQRYQQVLQQFFRPRNGELPRFDLVFLGLGADGHTASLFPGSAALHEIRRLVTSNWVDKLATHRITLTPAVFNNAACVIFLVAGADKANALQATVAGRGDAELIPAQLIEPRDGELLWIADRAAASRLDTN